MSKKKHKMPQTDAFIDLDQNDTFAFIAGYTSGGFPYGTKWEELGIDPALPMEEKKRLYTEGSYTPPSLKPYFVDDIKSILNTLDDIRVKLAVIGDLSNIPDLEETADSLWDVMERIAVWVEEPEISEEDLPF